MEPATPQSLLKDIIVSSTTVSSSASPADASAQSYKRKRESVRRCLFANSKQSNVEDIPEENVQDFDQVPIKLLKKKSRIQLLQKQIPILPKNIRSNNTFCMYISQHFPILSDCWQKCVI